MEIIFTVKPLLTTSRPVDWISSVIHNIYNIQYWHVLDWTKKYSLVSEDIVFLSETKLCVWLIMYDIIS